MSDNMKNFFNAIMGILDKFIKKESSDSKDEPIKEDKVINNEPIIDEKKPKLTISKDEPSGGNDCDVWMMYEESE